MARPLCACASRVGTGDGYRAVRGGLPAAVLATLRAELAHVQRANPWRKAWIAQRQLEQQAAPLPEASAVLAA